MKKLLITIVLFLVACSFCFAESWSFDYLGHRWHFIWSRGGDPIISFITTTNTLDELRELGRFLDFDIDRPSDIVLNTNREPVSLGWDSIYESQYVTLVRNEHLNRGNYYLEILYGASDFWKSNDMVNWIKIHKIGDNAFTRQYKSKELNHIHRFGP